MVRSIRRPQPALLDGQDRQRPELLPEVGQPKAKQGLHEIWMADTRAAAERAFDNWIKAAACLARESRRAALLLRLPRSALDAPVYDQRDRLGLRHHPSPELAGEGLRHPPHDALDDLQDGHECGAILAPATRLPAARQSHRGGQVRGRYRGHRGQQGRRMTNPPYTRFDNSSRTSPSNLSPCRSR